MGTGLILAVLVGFASAIPSLAFLESGYLELSVPLVGQVKFVSALLFDVGVYLVIVGISLGLIRSLGEERSDRPVGTRQ
jgi:multicomponent Na+:H+ antiporter subunit A